MQIADPTSHERGRPIDTRPANFRQQHSDRNGRKSYNGARCQDILTDSRKLTSTSTHTSQVRATVMLYCLQDFKSNAAHSRVSVLFSDMTLKICKFH
jgi:hypothetical protein